MYKKWYETQKELYPDAPVRKLHNLGDTQWACRDIACRNVRNPLDVLIVTLDDAGETGNSHRLIEARGILSQIDCKLCSVCICSETFLAKYILFEPSFSH
jgi:hypothetical protein